MTATAVPSRTACPAWFAGSPEEYERLETLLQTLRERERQRRRRLAGRCFVLLVAVAGGIGGLNRLVMADSHGVIPAEVQPLCIIIALLALMTLFEFVRFMESHLEHVDLHLGFARLAAEVVERQDIPDTVAASGPEADLHAQLRAFAAAHRQGREMMPSLLGAGFTPRPRRRNSDLLY